MNEEFRANVMVDDLTANELNRLYGPAPLTDEDLDALYDELYGDEDDDSPWNKYTE
jgi:hypothetical protein